MEEEYFRGCLNNGNLSSKLKAIREFRSQLKQGTGRVFAQPEELLLGLLESLQGSRDFALQREVIALIGEILGCFPELPSAARALSDLLKCFRRRKLRPLVQTAFLALDGHHGVPLAVKLLVHDGLEHDDKAVRLASVEILPILLCGECEDGGVDAALPEDVSFQEVLEGLVGRVRDLEDDVLDAALDALCLLASTHDQRFQATVPRLGPVHQHLIRHYHTRIYQQEEGEDPEAEREEVPAIDPLCMHSTILEPVFERSGDFEEDELESHRSRSANTPFFSGEIAEILRKATKRASMGDGQETPLQQTDGASPSQHQVAGVGGDRAFQVQSVLVRMVGGQHSPNGFDSSSLPHELPDILPLVGALCKDPNLKVSMVSMQLCGEVLRRAALTLQGRKEVCRHLKVLSRTLSEKCADNKMSVRHCALQGLAQLVGAVGLRALLPEMNLSLGHSSWHAREGALIVMTVGMLRMENETHSGPHNLDSHDMADIATLIVPLAGDMRETVQLAALDALAVLQSAWLSLPSTSPDFNLYRQLQEMRLLPCASHPPDGAQKIRARLASGNLPTLNPETGLLSQNLEAKLSSKPNLPTLQQCLSPGTENSRGPKSSDGSKSSRLRVNIDDAEKLFGFRDNTPAVSPIIAQQQKVISEGSRMDSSCTSLKSISSADLDDDDFGFEHYTNRKVGTGKKGRGSSFGLESHSISKNSKSKPPPAVRQGGFQNSDKESFDATRQMVQKGYVPSWQSPRSENPHKNFFATGALELEKDSEGRQMAHPGNSQEHSEVSPNTEDETARLTTAQRLDRTKLRTLKKHTISRKAQRRALSANQAESSGRRNQNPPEAKFGPQTPVPVGVYKADNPDARQHMETSQNILAPLGANGGNNFANGTTSDSEKSGGADPPHCSDKEQAAPDRKGKMRKQAALRSNRQVRSPSEERTKKPNHGFEDVSSGHRPAPRGSLTLDPKAGHQNTSLRQETFDYLTSEDIRPSPNPNQELQKTLRNLPNDDWPETFHTLNSVRRLALHHGSILESHLHQVVRSVLKQSENLRSAVKKNAILALEDIWRGLGPICDPELAMVAPALTKRVAESNGFLVDSAEKAISTIVDNATPRRALDAFIGSSKSRNPHIRAKTANVLYKLLMRMSHSLKQDSKELSRILSELPMFLQDANAETRNNAKHILNYLIAEDLVTEANLKRHIPDHVLTKALRSKPMMKGQHVMPPAPRPAKRGASSRPPSLSRADSRGESTFAQSARKGRAEEPGGKDSTTRANSRGRRTQSREPKARAPTAASTLTQLPELAELPDLYREMMSSNWRDRQRATEKVIELVKTYSQPLCESGRLVQVFDRVVERLQDGNLKVQLFILREMEQLIKELSNKLSPCLGTFIPALASNLAASNKQVASRCGVAMNALCEAVDDRLLCEWFAQLALTGGNAKVRVWMMAKLGDFSPSLYARKPALIRRHVLPVVWKSMAENKPDVRSATVKLLKTLDNVLPDITEYMASLSEEQKKNAEALLGRRK